MKIAAFNVQNLGWRKVNNPKVRDKLIKIISRYSVVVMLEVVDSSGRAMARLLRELNNSRGNIQHPYAMKKSRRLGRSTYMEQFVYFYKKAEVKLVKSYQYVERHEDIIAREPFILWFRCPNTVVKDLVLIPVHTKPEDTERELNALDDVVKDVKRRWRISNIMILGDFNADGRYLSTRRRQNIRIHRRPYHWLIHENADTTSSDSNDHTYDRIVVYGDDMKQATVLRSAKPFNFQKIYRLSKATTRAISDHYPVEVKLK
ncbi:deoxyribonuclease-1-like 1 [Scomber japonicus]|uniref:deoxyribonuclease-1-like 1 n=1 Tax=Scomber japonicus TaxID=13676 RepID=UPI0023066410|nr:deoxyribonuclease-1-like 1 [Scomber japonicus]